MKYYRKKKIALLILTMSTIPVSLKAQTEQSAGLSASIKTAAGYDDNILKTAKQYEREDNYLIATPELNVLADMGKHEFILHYEGEYSKYDKYKDVDYNDSKIKFGAKLDHSYRLNSNFEAGYNYLHERPGESDRILNSFNQFSIYDLKYAEAKLVYGTDESQGKIAGTYNTSKIDYKNNNQDFRDRDEDRIELRFYYKVAAKTRVVFETIFTDSVYKNIEGQINRNNTNEIYRIGVTWDATNTINGEMKIGYQNRDFDDTQAVDSDGISYEADLKWNPASYSTLKLTAKRLTLDSSLEGVGSFLRSSYAIEYKHSVTSFTDLQARIGYTDDEILSTNGRNDTGYSILLSANHELNRRLEIGANVRVSERNSSIDLADYSGKLLEINAKLKFD